MMVRKALERRQPLNWTIREGLSVLRQSFGHIPVITLCLVGPNSPLIAYNNGDGLFNGFPLSAGGMMLSFVSSGCWRNTRYRVLAEQVLLWRLPHLAPQCCGQQHLAASSCPSSHLGSFHSASDETPACDQLSFGKFQRVNFQQIPPAWHCGDSSAIREPWP